MFFKAVKFLGCMHIRNEIAPILLMGGVRVSLNTRVYVKHEEALDSTISAINNPQRCKVESLFVCKYCFDSVSMCTSAGLKLKSTCFGFPRARITGKRICF